MGLPIITGKTPTAPKVLIYGLPGCIDGDAMITFKSSLFENDNCSKKIRLKNLHKRFNGQIYQGWRGEHSGEEIYVRSIDEETSKFVWSKVEDVYYSGMKQVYKIKTESRETIATATHLFWTDSGWKKLSEIDLSKDKVAVSGRMPHKIGGKKALKSREVFVKYHPIAPHKIVNGIEYCRLAEHRFIYEASLNGMTTEEYKSLLNNYDGRDIKVIPRDMEVHHLNGDHTDNRVENMELLSKREHALKGIDNSLKTLEEAQKAVFEKVISVEPAGEKATYDIRCSDPYHSFLADNFVVHNTGKSTLAAKLKRPLFLDFEGGLNYMDVARLPQIQSFDEFVNYLVFMNKSPKSENYDTLVIDSADWMVRKAIEKAAGIDRMHLTETLVKSNGGYGAGFEVYANYIRTQVLPALVDLNKKGYGICMIAHADKKKMMGADGIDFEQIAPKIDARTMNVFVEWVDNVFYLKKNDNGERVLLLDSDDVALAKNRLGKTGEVKLADIDINDLLTMQDKKGEK